MTDRELWCFVSKYRQLLSARKTATLLMESPHVNLKVFLNPAEHPQEEEQQHQHCHQARVQRRVAGSARERRRARRAQTRHAAAQVQSRTPDVSPPQPPPPNIVEDAAVQDPAVAAVPNPPPHFSVHSPQHTAADAVRGQTLATTPTSS